MMSPCEGITVALVGWNRHQEEHCDCKDAFWGQQSKILLESLVIIAQTPLVFQSSFRQRFQVQGEVTLNNYR